MKVALYSRVAVQQKERITSQIEALRAHAQEMKYAVDENYVCSDDGCSGTRLARPELDRLRNGVQAGAFDAVLTCSPDRLSRAYSDLTFLLQEFESFGIRIIFVVGQTLPPPPSTSVLHTDSRSGQPLRSHLLPNVTYAKSSVEQAIPENDFSSNRRRRS
jgi:DNA invertase Pin-like site-specific DNA recombinase